MDYVHIINIGNSYTCDNGSDLKMELLGLFLADDISCHNIIFLRNWILNPQYTETETNITTLEKQGDYIILKDLFPQEGYEHAMCKMTAPQLLQLIHDWEDLVCRQKPKEVTILYDNDNDQFTIK